MNPAQATRRWFPRNKKIRTDLSGAWRHLLAFGPRPLCPNACVAQHLPVRLGIPPPRAWADHRRRGDAWTLHNTNPFAIPWDAESLPNGPNTRHLRTRSSVFPRSARPPWRDVCTLLSIALLVIGAGAGSNQHSVFLCKCVCACVYVYMDCAHPKVLRA